MNSAELARVTEIQPVRQFDVLNDGAKEPSRVYLNRESDTLYCARHQKLDGCTCTARVRLSGVLAGGVRDLTTHRPPELNHEKMAANVAANETRAKEVGL